MCVTDGAKALRKGLKLVLGDNIEIQRCYLHKIRNIKSYLQDNHHAELTIRFRRMMGCEKYREASREYDKLLRWLKSTNSKASSSLEESKKEILTLHRLGLPSQLRKSFESTNLIESLFSIVRNKTNRVKNWNRSKDQRLRWAVSSIAAHKKKMRKIRGYKLLPMLTQALTINEVDKKPKSA